MEKPVFRADSLNSFMHTRDPLSNCNCLLLMDEESPLTPQARIETFGLVGSAVRFPVLSNQMFAESFLGGQLLCNRA